MSASTVEALKGYDRELHRFLVRRLRRPQDADDLVQEVYTRLLASKDRAIEKPLPYLYGIASHVLADFRIEAEQERRIVTVDSDTVEEWTEQASCALPDDIAERLDLQQQIDRALASLTPRQRTVVLLHHRDGWSYDEIAAKLGCSWETVSRHLVDAKVRMRSIFPNEAGNSPRCFVTTKGARYYEDSVAPRAEAQKRAVTLRASGFWASVMKLSNGMAKVVKRRRPLRMATPDRGAA